ncbi:iron dicitrate transport regulator FecR, partial [Tatlockia micdadei]
DAFVTELSRQTGIPMECADDVAALHVSGVFQLDGPDPAGRALAAIARTLPVRVERGQGAASGAHSAMRLVKA